MSKIALLEVEFVMTRTIRHILCVDDHEDTCSMLKILLSDYKVTSVGTCAEALKRAKTRLINLYLLDNWLPDGTGVELCKQIREVDPNTPILFYSAAAYDSDRDEAFKAGALGYLIKPNDITRLADVIKQLILQAEVTSISARIAEIEAIRDEVRQREVLIAERMERVKKLELKHQSRQVFIQSGGNRATFERMWPDVYRSQVSK
jgi:DNA-binding response OmpR family regulator